LQGDDADQVHRSLALATLYDGTSKTEAAKIGGVTLAAGAVAAA